MTAQRLQQRFWIKLFGVLSLIRGDNIVVLALTQYLIAHYIVAPKLTLTEVVFDFKLFCLVLASCLVASAGYIINNFFDAAKDQINRPKKYLLRHLLSQQEQLVLFPRSVVLKELFWALPINPQDFEKSNYNLHCRAH